MSAPRMTDEQWETVAKFQSMGYHTDTTMQRDGIARVIMPAKTIDTTLIMFVQRTGHYLGVTHRKASASQYHWRHVGSRISQQWFEGMFNDSRES